MADHPIPFSAPMIRAILREIERPGTGKTQTRRVMRVQRAKSINQGDRLWVRETHKFRGADYGDSDGVIEWFRCYGNGGAIDNWDPDFPAGWEPSIHDAPHLLTRPSEQEGGDIRGYVTKLRPSMFMPRWASRLTLYVTDVRVERLQGISEADARAEGVRQDRDGAGTFIGREGPGSWVTPWLTAKEAYADLWNAINGPGAWEANPWVYCVTFTPFLKNIDQMGATT